ncbi:MAG: hypothetical protein GF330_04225 [Candidatus Eisenbacteria bacterium]|nr:hypothetical protein [Candidatus Eisenbacteria bacterium]
MPKRSSRQPRRRRAPHPARVADAPPAKGAGIPALLSQRFLWRASLLTALALLASGLTFDPKLYVNGDNVDYILLAERLIEDGIWWDSRKFPPFFPILLAPVQLLFGTAWLPQKLLVFGLYLASAPLLLRVGERVLPRPLAFAGSLLGLLSIPVLEFSHYVMSEVPFLFLTLLALVVGERLIATRLLRAPAASVAVGDESAAGANGSSPAPARAPNPDTRTAAAPSAPAGSARLPTAARWLGIYLLLAAAAFYTRSIGAALAAALLCVLLLQGRWRWALLALGLWLATLVPWILHSYGSGAEGATYLQQVVYQNPYYPDYGKLDAASLLTRLARNADRYLLHEIPIEIIPAVYRSTYSVDPAARSAALPLPAALAVIGLVAAGAVAAWRRAPLMVAYAGTSLLVALLWPPIWASVRFVLPILPLLTLFFLRGCDLLLRELPVRRGGVRDFRRSQSKGRQPALIVRLATAPRLSIAVLSALVGALLALAVYNVARYGAETETYPRPWASYFAAADWAGRHLPPGSLVLDRKPNIFGLVTDLPAITFPRERDPEKMLDYLRERGVQYVHAAIIPYDDFPRILYPFLASRSHYFDVIWVEDPEAMGSFLLEFHPEGGRRGFILEHSPPG